ncbi:DUF1120 domain-containing protein [Enterobacter ludwigii]|uniref:DUF1120 domain-containing protein n=1 Tax=Enterobacter ludwigii TaxID=299767 RepID=UPI004067E855
MKKLLLATLIAVASHAALADSTVVMKVKGKMNNASCTPELSNGGSIDFGTIALDQLSPTQTNQMGQKDMSLTITCPSATKVAWSIADNKEDTNAANDLTSSQSTSAMRRITGVMPGALVRPMALAPRRRAKRLGRMPSQHA